MLPPVNDDAWVSLLDQKNIDSARAAGEKKYDKLTSDEVKELRWMAKHDLFFLVAGILGYDRLSPKLHGNICGWLERNRAARFRELLLPRGHFKTTIATIGDSIQTSLPGGEDLAWPRNLGTDARILLAHETDKGASRFLFEITQHFTSNPALMGLFPECIPSPRLQRMNQNELELPRRGFWAEPTFDTMGVGAKSQGRHYSQLKLDDLFGDKARDSQAERETTLQWFDNIQSFFVKINEGILDLIGTRYSVDDLYGHAEAIYGPQLLKYVRRVEEYNEETEQLEAIFPEEYTPEALAILRKNVKVWAQYTNDPQQGVTAFQQEWKRFYHWAGPGKKKLIFFSGQANVPTTYEVRKDLDIVILIDPAVTGTPGIVVTGTDAKTRVFVLEAIKQRMAPPEFVNKLFELVIQYWPRLVSIEEVVFSAVYRPWIEREMQIRNLRFNIYPYKPPKNKVKFERVKGLSNYYSASQIWYNEGLTDLIWEYDNLGATDDYHLHDALAQGPEIWRPFMGKKMEENRLKELERLERERDVLTGYSVI